MCVWEYVCMYVCVYVFVYGPVRMQDATEMDDCTDNFLCNYGTPEVHFTDYGCQRSTSIYASVQCSSKKNHREKEREREREREREGGK